MIWKRRKREREIEEEIRGHLRMAERDRVERGEAAWAARAGALREFGNRGLVAETTREVWGWGAVERVGQDLRYAARALRRSPGFTAIAIGTLALGIGATTALFSAIEAVLLRPLPYKNPGELVAVSRPAPKFAGEFVLTPTFAAWRRELHGFASLAAWNDEAFNLTGAGEPERVIAASVNAEFLRTLGVAPYIGSDFEIDQDRETNQRFVLLGYELWQRHYRGDPSVVGRSAVLNDHPYTIVGVLPHGFRFPGDIRPELLVPGGYSDPPNWAAQMMGLLRVVGRPRPGVSASSLIEEIESVERAHAQDYRAGDAAALRGGRAQIAPLAEHLNGSVRKPLLILWGAVSLVLLLICANVAGLQLARSSARSGELALRAALGAGRARLARLIVGESLLVALAGGGVGVLCAYWLIESLRAAPALGLPSPDAVQLNGAVLAFGLAVTLATGVFAGLLPALLASRPALAETMKASSRTVSRGWTGGVRRALVVGEVALALILLLGAGLLLRSVYRLLTQPLGIDATRVVTMRVRLGGSQYREDVRRAAFVDEWVARARAVPGVEHAAATSSVPLTGYGLGMRFRPEGAPMPGPGQAPGTAVLLVTPDYFATMRVPLLAGRAFTDADGPDGALVAIVNRSFAEKYFGGQNAVGKHIQFAMADNGPWVTIVGVAADTRHRGPMRAPEPEVFRPHRQMAMFQPALVVRASVPPLSLVPALRAQARQIDPELPVFDVMGMEERVALATASQRLELGLIGFFAAVATVLAALGVYGVIAHAVSQRTHEIGLRLALGAPPGRVERSVAAGGMRMAVAGVVLGLAGGYGLTRYLRTLLFEVGEHDAMTFAAASAVLLGMALVASWLPARRAARVDPVVALRCD